VDIAFIVSHFPSLSETFVLNQITGLLERGHAVDIFARSGNSRDPLHPDVERYGLLARTRYLACPRSKWLRLIYGARLCARQIPKNARAVLGALNVLRYGRNALSLTLLFSTVPFFRKYDIIHCQFGPNGHFGTILKRLGLQEKLVVTFHGYDIRLGSEKGRSLYADLWQAADCVLAISPYNYEQLIGLGADATRMAYHPVGIDCKRFAYRAAACAKTGGGIRLISVGRLVEEKGFAHGIRAVRKLLSRRPELELRYEIIGGGPLQEALERLIRESRLENHVILRGAKDQNAIVRALNQSDVFLCPSLAEALPVALMEAQAVGLPVIATRVGSVDQIVLDGRSGFIIPPGDDDALVEKLRVLLEQRERWPEMGTIGRLHVEQHYDIETLNDRLVGLYQRLLAPSACPRNNS